MAGNDCRIRWRTTPAGSTRSRLFLLPFFFLPFTTPIAAFNRGKQVISPRGSTDHVLWGETSAESLDECDDLTELVRSFEFRILAIFAVSSHPFWPLSGFAAHLVARVPFPFRYTPIRLCNDSVPVRNSSGAFDGRGDHFFSHRPSWLKVFGFKNGSVQGRASKKISG